MQMDTAQVGALQAQPDQLGAVLKLSEAETDDLTMIANQIAGMLRSQGMKDLAGMYETKSNGEEHKGVSFPKIERHQFEQLDVSHNAKGKSFTLKDVGKMALEAEMRGVLNQFL